MAQNNAYDNPWMKAFDPEQMRQMWDPQRMMSMFQPQQQSNPFDMEEIIKANQRNFDAMAEANKSAAEAYKGMIDKQMEIFNQLTDKAREQYDWIEQNAGPDKMKAKTAAMNEAVEEALKMMRKMADEARAANEEAFKMVQGQMSEATAKVEESAKKAANAAKKS